MLHLGNRLARLGQLGLGCQTQRQLRFQLVLQRHYRIIARHEAALQRLAPLLQLRDLGARPLHGFRHAPQLRLQRLMTHR